MPSPLQLSTILASNVLLAVSILIFAQGFFPYKALLPDLAQWKETDLRVTAPPPFDRVIFMVVDALRSDFVYSNQSNFLFTQSLIRDGAAMPFTGHASPPTITMPRVKAITTGSVPSFVDLVLNFAESDTTSTLATQDSWLAQMRAKGTGKLVMYGDDTWLRLFPGFFNRSDGTTSFFVSDFTEVDNNVTRHVPPELEKDDWSAMTLHYLGLDHIGHKTGPRGPNMPAKQQEMDGIMETIYQALGSQNHLSSTLLILLGDHGMNEAGNHGASSAGEVSTALTFISPKFKFTFPGLPSPASAEDGYMFYEKIEQSDIAPTLAALLDFPVPSNNLGVIIPSLLKLWKSDSDKYALLYQNAKQVADIAAATFPSAFKKSIDSETCSLSAQGDLDELACEWSRLSVPRPNAADLDKELPRLQHFLYKAQRTLSGTASNYDKRKLLYGIGIGLASFAAANFGLSTVRKTTLEKLVFRLFNFSYGTTMFASSYVEEEHQFWYWFAGGWLALLYARAGRHKTSGLGGPIAIGLFYLLFGVLRRWKQTGQKYAGDPDLLSEVITANPWNLWMLVIVTYSVFSRNLSRRATEWMNSKQMGLLPVLVAISAFVFKVAFTAADAPELIQGVVILDPLVAFTYKYPLLNLARVAFVGLLQLFASAIFYEKPWRGRAELLSFLKTFQDVLSLFLLTQTRTSNIPLFLAFYVQNKLLERCDFTESFDVSFTSIILQFSSFFAFGGTNAISSVDLSNAYNGIGGYNVAAVGILTFISNWAGSIWWSVATCRLLILKHSASASALAFDHFVLLTMFITTSTAFVMIACFVLREHLFIWTVFSPKYLYAVAWVFGQHLVVNGLCTVLLGLGKN